MSWSDLTVRKWYIYHDKRIYEQIDSSLPMEEKARRAFELRNEYQTQARNLMANQTERARLDKEHPNPTWEYILKHKLEDKNDLRTSCEDHVWNVDEIKRESESEIGIGVNLNAQGMPVFLWDMWFAEWRIV